MARQGPDLGTVQQKCRSQSKGNIKKDRRTPSRSMRQGRAATELEAPSKAPAADASSRRVSTGPGERQRSTVEVAATPSMRHPAVRRRDAGEVRGRVAVGLATPSSRDLPSRLRWSLGLPTLGPAGRNPRTAYMFPVESDLSTKLLLS